MTRVFIEACQMHCISHWVPLEMHCMDKNLTGLHNKRLTDVWDGRLERCTIMYRVAGTSVCGEGVWIKNIDLAFKCWLKLHFWNIVGHNQNNMHEPFNHCLLGNIFQVCYLSIGSLDVLLSHFYFDQTQQLECDIQQKNIIYYNVMFTYFSSFIKKCTSIEILMEQRHISNVVYIIQTNNPTFVS